MSYHFKYSLTPEEYEEYVLFTAWEAPWQKNIRRKFIINNPLAELISQSMFNSADWFVVYKFV